MIAVKRETYYTETRVRWKPCSPVSSSGQVKTDQWLRQEEKEPSIGRKGRFRREHTRSFTSTKKQTLDTVSLPVEEKDSLHWFQFGKKRLDKDKRTGEEGNNLISNGKPKLRTDLFFSAEEKEKGEGSLRTRIGSRKRKKGRKKVRHFQIEGKTGGGKKIAIRQPGSFESYYGVEADLRDISIMGTTSISHPISSQTASGGGKRKSPDLHGGVCLFCRGKEEINRDHNS